MSDEKIKFNYLQGRMVYMYAEIRSDKTRVAFIIIYYEQGSGLLMIYEALKT